LYSVDQRMRQRHFVVQVIKQRKQSVATDMKLSIADMFRRPYVQQSTLGRTLIVHNQRLEKLKVDFVIFTGDTYKIH
jgi:hypothetical protein